MNIRILHYRLTGQTIISVDSLIMLKYLLPTLLMGMIPIFAQPALVPGSEATPVAEKKENQQAQESKPEAAVPAATEPRPKTLVKLPGLKIRNMSGYGQFGWQQLSLTSLNSSMSDAGYSSLSTDYFTGGGGGHLSLERVVLGLDGDVAWNVAKQNTLAGNTYKSWIMAVRLSGIIGYLVYTREHLDIFPYLGVGYSQMNLTIQNTQEESFNNFLTNPQRGAWLNSSSFVLTTGVQLMFRVPLISFGNAIGGLLLGGKLGMNFGLGGDNWTSGSVSNTVSVTGGAAATYTGPFAQAVIGTYLNFNP